MRIAVVGLWHLGSVYAACLASLGHDVVGIDDDEAVVTGLAAGRAPLFERGLDSLLAEGLDAQRLSFSTSLGELHGAEIVWIAADTLVNDDDTADVASVVALTRRALARTDGGATFVVSSQVPAGMMSDMATWLDATQPGADVELAYVPENLRLGSAIECFFSQRPWIVGTAGDRAAPAIAAALTIDIEDVVQMTPTSAEFVKHALNSFLAVSVAFANEVGRLCLIGGADPEAVLRSVMADPRVGQRAYLRSGPPIEGGTLARDVVFLNAQANTAGAEVPVLASILQSNSDHCRFIINEVARAGVASRAPVGVVGLGYKQGSSTLRRSFGLQMCIELVDAGIDVRVFDAHLTGSQASSMSLVAVPAPQDLFSTCGVVVWNQRERPDVQASADFTRNGGVLMDIGDLGTLVIPIATQVTAERAAH